MKKRNIVNKINSDDLELIVPVTKGGTGDVNTQDLSQNLGLVLTQHRNVANGIAGLDASGRIYIEHIPDDLNDNTVNIEGLNTVPVNSVNEYTIISYSNFNTYTIEVSSGVVIRTDDVITFSAPSVPETVILTVNGRQFVLNVVPIVEYVVTPSITSPLNNSSDLGRSVSFIANEFIASGGVDTHEGTDWQVATDIGFTNLVADIVNDVNNKTSWTVSGLEVSTTYYARVRYKGTSMGYSNWSNISTFTTKANFLPTNEVGKINTGSFTGIGGYGYNIDIDEIGERFIVSAENTHITTDPFTGVPVTNKSFAGCVFVYVKINGIWQLETRLFASDYALNDIFGRSISINATGDTIVVGAYFEDPGNTTDAGSVYVFTRTGTTWTQQAKLVANDKTADDLFGSSVSINPSGDMLAIGCPRTKISGTSRGSVYIFTRSGSTWTQEAKLMSSDLTVGQDFGSFVKLDNLANRLYIGAVGDYSSNGAVYIFTRSGSVWTEEVKLISPDRTSEDDHFGENIVVNYNSDIIAIGSPFFQGRMGAVYIYSRIGTTWTYEAKLTKPVTDSASNNPYIGQSLSMNENGDVLIVGAQNINTDITGVGAVYIFTRSGTTWTQEARLIASDRVQNDRFGRAVVLNKAENTLLVTTDNDSTVGVPSKGSVYIFN